MRIYLLQLLFIATLNTYSIISYGQEPTSGKSMSQIPEPLYIINSTIIANGLFMRLDPKDIENLVVYREQTVPDLLENLAVGIIAITYNKPVESKSFAEIGLQQGLRGPLSFVLNGHKLNAAQVATLRIVPEAIGQLEVRPAATETIINIQLTEAKTNSGKNAPGTIMIR